MVHVKIPNCWWNKIAINQSKQCAVKGRILKVLLKQIFEVT